MYYLFGHFLIWIIELSLLFSTGNFFLLTRNHDFYVQALAEWVIYTSSGIASGIYHACDVGTWCPLEFNTLQVHTLSETHYNL